MSRKRLLVALRIALAVLVAAGAVRWWPSRGPHIDQAHCDRIMPGMRREEIVAILGGPPSVEVDPSGGNFLGRSGPFPARAWPPGAWWEDDEGIVSVSFRDDGTALVRGIHKKGHANALGASAPLAAALSAAAGAVP